MGVFARVCVCARARWPGRDDWATEKRASGWNIKHPGVYWRGQHTDASVQLHIIMNLFKARKERKPSDELRRGRRRESEAFLEWAGCWTRKEGRRQVECAHEQGSRRLLAAPALGIHRLSVCLSRCSNISLTSFLFISVSLLCMSSSRC